MAGAHLDSAGVIKLKTLEEAQTHLQRIHAVVEQYAMAVKRNQPSTVFMMNLRRQLPSLAENLKSQFGLIAEQATQLNLTTSRGGSENQRVRQLREGVAHIRQALEIAVTQTRDRHSVKEGQPGPANEEGKGP